MSGTKELTINKESSTAVGLMPGTYELDSLLQSLPFIGGWLMGFQHTPKCWSLTYHPSRGKISLISCMQSVLHIGSQICLISLGRA